MPLLVGHRTVVVTPGAGESRRTRFSPTIRPALVESTPRPARWRPRGTSPGGSHVETPRTGFVLASVSAELFRWPIPVVRLVSRGVEQAATTPCPRPAWARGPSRRRSAERIVGPCAAATRHRTSTVPRPPLAYSEGNSLRLARSAGGAEEHERVVDGSSRRSFGGRLRGRRRLTDLLCRGCSRRRCAPCAAPLAERHARRATNWGRRIPTALCRLISHCRGTRTVEPAWSHSVRERPRDQPR